MRRSHEWDRAETVAAEATPAQDAMMRLQQLRDENATLQQRLGREKRARGHLNEVLGSVMRQLNQGGPSLREVVVCTYRKLEFETPGDLADFARQSKEFASQMQRFAQFLHQQLQQQKKEFLEDFEGVFPEKMAMKEEEVTKVEVKPRRKIMRAAGVIAGDEDSDEYSDDSRSRHGRRRSSRSVSPSGHGSSYRGRSRSRSRSPLAEHVRNAAPIMQVKSASEILADELNQLISSQSGQKLPISQLGRCYREHYGRKLNLQGFGKMVGLLRSLKPFGLTLDNNNVPRFVCTNTKPPPKDYSDCGSMYSATPKNSPPDSRPSGFSPRRAVSPSTYNQNMRMCREAGVCQFYNFASCKHAANACKYRHECLHCRSKSHGSTNCAMK